MVSSLMGFVDEISQSIEKCSSWLPAVLKSQLFPTKTWRGLVYCRRYIMWFLFCFTFLQCHKGSCACKRSWKLKSQVVVPLMGAPLSHCSWSALNMSSVVLTIILWLLCHCVMYLYNLCLYPRSEVKLTGSCKQNRAVWRHGEQC